MHDLILDLKEIDISFVWAIHESEVDHYLEGLKFKKESFDLCEKIIFASVETQKLYLDFLKDDRHSVIVPNGIDFEAIELFKKKHPQSLLRKEYGHKEDDLIISVIGTVCERKGQQDFVNTAIYLLRSGLVNKEKTYFYVVGYKDVYGYGSQIKKMISDFGYEGNIRVVGETDKIFDYYYIPDIFICSSYIESFPLVVLEAMAFEKPILSSNVYGVKEQIKDGEHGFLYTPGGFVEMKDCLLKLIHDDRLRGELGAAAFSRAKKEFQLKTMQERYGELFFNIFNS